MATILPFPRAQRATMPLAAELEADARRAIASADRALVISTIAMLHGAKLRAQLAGEPELATLYHEILASCRDEIERALAC